MINVRELRIGNYYSADTPGSDFKNCFQITAKDILELNDDPQDDHYQPVILTEEWLLMFGFKSNQINPQLFMGYWLFIYNCKDDGFAIYKSGNNGDAVYLCHLKFVHNLQNLYQALKGEELEINN